MSRRKKSTEKDLISAIYSVMIITLAIIGLLYQETGFLGTFLHYILCFVFGNLWFIPLGCAILVCICSLFKFKIKQKYVISFVLLLFASILIASIIYYKKDVTGLSVIGQYFHLYPNKYNYGGFIGSVLYGLISAASSFVGAIIVGCVLSICGISFLVPTIYSKISNWFNSVRRFFNSIITKKQDRPRSVSKKKKNNFKIIDIKKKDDIDDKFNKEPEVKKEEKPQQITKVPKEEEKPAEKPVNSKPTSTGKSAPYSFPGLNYLEEANVSKDNVNRNNAKEKWSDLEDILDSFGLSSSLQKINVGPSVTQFEIVPNGTFNIRKFSTIQENIKMDLAVKDVRIEAPIPGKKAIGIEIPNVNRVPVRLKELMKHIPTEYQNTPLLMALGKDLSGNCVYGSIDKMPHLLIAGSTGSGKSVCINSMILTLLLRARPQEVRLLLIDPKKVEFTPYENIPHLLCPVINDTSKAAGALKHLVEEMEHRYEVFKNNGVRKIEEYNNKNPNNRMYNIVCIIDELADLMLTHKEVEQHINRLASLARASGIYMILATQRPSVDVITGTIKANIVSRIAFAVSSSYDSKTIIDGPGAETLFGNGDMLYVPQGASSPLRVQGVYVSDTEINNITSYFVNSGITPAFDNDRFNMPDEDEYGPMGETVNNDPMYPQIEAWVKSQKTISASGLQRRFGLGFPRAAKIIDALEQNGIISTSNGSKPRDVLVQFED